MIFIDNEQLIIELKKIMLEKKITQKELSAKMGLTPQGFTKLINKKNFGFLDMKKILDVLEMEMDINFK